MDIRLGIVGFGSMGEIHSYYPTLCNRLEVAGIYDIDPARLELAKQKGFDIFESLDDLLSKSGANVIMVATPNHLHAPIAIACMDRGFHVVVEKPAALSVAQFDTMTQAAIRNNVLFTVHQNRRQDADYLIVRQTLESGVLGKVYSLDSRVHGSRGPMWGWRGEKNSGGGMIWDWGVHLFDQLLQIKSQKIVSVAAQLHHIASLEVDDFFKVLLRFEDGVSAFVEVSTTCYRRTEPRWFVCGNVGTLCVQNWDCEGDITRIIDDPGIPEAGIAGRAGPTRSMAMLPEACVERLPLPAYDGDWTTGFARYFDALADAVIGKAPLVVQPHEVRRVLQLIEAVFEADQKGEMLKVSI